MNSLSLKREKTPWTKSHKKFRLKKKEKGNLFNESRRKELATVTKVPLGVWFFGSRHNFSSHLLISAFSTAITQQCSTATANLPANSVGYLCCEHSGVPKLLFHWSAAYPVDSHLDEV